MSNIGFIGIGKLGLECAEACAEKGHSVFGYDIEKKPIRKVIQQQTIKETVQDRDIVFVAVPTPHDPNYDGREPCMHLEPKDFSYNIVKSVLAEANKYMNKDQLLVLISTVLPGTTRREFIDLIPNTRFVYNPYLIAMGSVAWDMVNPEMVMIGTEDGSETGDAKQLTDFYKTVMENNPRYVIGTWDECEAIKIFYNTFISAKVGLVNMIQDVAMKVGNINVDVVTDALRKSDMRIMGPKYMTAGMGDGGACHPRDNIALRYMAERCELGYDLFEAIMYAREKQAQNMAEYMMQSNPKQLPYVIVGKAYKPKTPYLDGSPSMLVGHYLNKYDVNPTYYYDPGTGDYPPQDIGPAVYLLAHNSSVTYSYQGDHPDNDGSEITIPLDIVAGSVIIDPWRECKPIEGVTVIHYGNTRRQ